MIVEFHLCPARRSASPGFTLVELLTVIAIVAVLAALVAVGYGPALNRAEGAVCLSHMRSLHVSLAAYVQDKGMWPQEPEGSNTNQMLNEDWWLGELGPYGAVPVVWLCPTIKRMTAGGNPRDIPRIHYVPGAFDALPTSPYQYATQPWLIEIAGVHGHGPRVCFPDGSIRSMDDLLKK